MKLGVYIQVPFCQTKCTYCNFHTGVVSRERYAPYAAAVRREIEAWFAECGSSELGAAKIDTVYFGGGTPSLLDPAALASIWERLRPRFAETSSVEITLEADPETIDSQKAAAWRGAGFNRVSLGAQSFNDTELRAAGRMHRRADIFPSCAGVARRWLCQYQHGLDRWPATSNARVLGRLGKRTPGDSAGTRFDLHARN